MHPVTELSISLFYSHPEVGTSYLFHLARGEGVIAPDDLGPDAFRAASGGLRIAERRIYTLLETDAAGDLYSYVAFLLQALVGLSDADLPPELERFRSDGTFMGHEHVVAELLGEDESQLLLQRSDGGLALSYLDASGDAPATRLSPYFSAVHLDRDAFVREAAVALDEYFAVARERTRSAPHHELGKRAAHWKAHRARLTQR
jgi:hypothetical protein